MNLDDINPSPIYSVTIPSTGKKASFRPFAVKEERALLSAQESEDESVMMNTLIQVVRNCVDPEQSVLTNFDFEYLFTRIRAKSVGETSSLLFGCKQCGHEGIKADINLDDVKVEFGNKEKDVKINDQITVRLRYLTIDEYAEIESTSPPGEAKYRAIIESIDKIFVGEEFVSRENTTPESIKNFIDRLASDQFKKLSEFLDNIPYAKVDVEYDCPSCQTHNVTELRGLSNFF